MSQSYSCWYWVLSEKKRSDSLITSRLNPILAGTGFCQFPETTPDAVSRVSILFLLVLGSVIENIVIRVRWMKSQSYSCWYWVLSEKSSAFQLLDISLNPILAGTGFCQLSPKRMMIIGFCLNPILAGTGFCPDKKFGFTDTGVSILFLLVLGSVIIGCIFTSERRGSQSYSCCYCGLSRRRHKTQNDIFSIDSIIA